MSEFSNSNHRVRVMMIALEFAPAQTTGMFRSLRFAKNLQKFGVDPVIVTIDPDQACENFGVPNNPALLADLPEGVEIHHLRFKSQNQEQGKLSKFVKLWARISDGYYARLRESLGELLRSGKLGEVDAIYATLPPFGAGDLAIEAKKHLKKPLIVDMRDAWSQWGSSPFPTVIHYLGARQLERKVLENADSVIAVTNELKSMLEGLVSVERKEKFVCIPNASDIVDFPSKICWNANGNAPINVGYVGSFYFNEKTHEARSKKWFQKPIHYWPHYYATEQDWSYRTPNYFFEAWSELDKRYPDIGKRLRFHLIGTTPDWLPVMARKWNVSERCIFHGRLLKQEVATALNNLDFLLSTSIKVPDGRDYCLASKSFEYITSGKPTLGFVCDGSQKEFIEESNTGVVFAPDNVQQASDRMAKLFGSGISLEPNLNYLQQYSADCTTEKVARCMFKLCVQSNGSVD